MLGLTKLLGSSTFALGLVINVAHYAIFGTWSEDLMAWTLGGYAAKEAADKVGAGLKKAPDIKPGQE